MTCNCHDRKIAYPNLVRALRALTGRDRLRPCNKKDRCDNLVFEIQDLKRELGRLADRMEYGRERIEELREAAIRGLLFGAAAALLGALGPLARAIQIARRIAGTRGIRRLSRDDLFALVEAFVPFGVTIGALHQYVDDLIEIQQVIDDLEDYEAGAESLRDQLVPLIDEAQAIDCFDSDDFGA